MTGGDDELLQAMWGAFQRHELTGHTDSPMVAVLDVLHKAGYRRCAEGQKVTQWCAEVEKAQAAKDGAYLERNQCVALIARMAHALGYWAGTAKTAIDGWSEDWHGCVYIDLPAGQVSWHYHDSQAYLFDWLPPYCAEWDGHDTPEKYRRVLDRASMPNARAEKAEAEVERLRADAERYRKWRHEFREGSCGLWNALCEANSDAEHDAVIDAARGESQ